MLEIFLSCYIWEPSLQNIVESHALVLFSLLHLLFHLVIGYFFFLCSLQDLYLHSFPWFNASCSLQHDGFSSLGFWAGEDHGLSSLAICHYFVGYKQCYISCSHSAAGGTQSFSYKWLPHEWVCYRLLRSSIFDDCYRDKPEWSSIQEVGYINIAAVREFTTKGNMQFNMLIIATFFFKIIW